MEDRSHRPSPATAKGVLRAPNSTCIFIYDNKTIQYGIVVQKSLPDEGTEIRSKGFVAVQYIYVCAQLVICDCVMDGSTFIPCERAAVLPLLQIDL
jgi:hypothetical protein